MIVLVIILYSGESLTVQAALQTCVPTIDSVIDVDIVPSVRNSVQDVCRKPLGREVTPIQLVSDRRALSPTKYINLSNKRTLRKQKQRSSIIDHSKLPVISSWPPLVVKSRVQLQMEAGDHILSQA